MRRFHSLLFLFMGRARTNGERASGRIPSYVFTMSNSEPRRGGETHVGTKFLAGKDPPVAGE